MSEEEKTSQQDGVARAETESEEDVVPWKIFLEEYPVGTIQKVSGYWRDTGNSGYYRYERFAPTLRLVCDKCDGIRNFDGKWTHHSHVTDPSGCDDFLVYTCRDCHEFEKHYCIYSDWANDGSGVALKIGEYPQLNIEIPSSLPKLLGEDYRYFIKGLKCEKQGFGVGAYTYYRRVLENQKGRVFGEILRVVSKLNAKQNMIEAIENAIKETQFSKAIDMVKDALPDGLLIGGHNPFKLLHKALSIGIHNQPDEKCLKLAHDIRIVLTDLSKRIKDVLSEEKRVEDAVSSLLEFNQEES